MSDIAPVSRPLPASAPGAAAVSRPTGEAPASPAPEPPRTPERLQRELDEAIAESQTSLRFRVDAQSDRIVVAVLDAAGEVVMQIPDEAALAVARHLARTGALLDLSA